MSGEKPFLYAPPDSLSDDEEEPETILCRVENLECETSSLRFELEELLEALEKVLRRHRARYHPTRRPEPPKPGKV